MFLYHSQTNFSFFDFQLSLLIYFFSSQEPLQHSSLRLERFRKHSGSCSNVEIFIFGKPTLYKVIFQADCHLQAKRDYFELRIPLLKPSQKTSPIQRLDFVRFALTQTRVAMMHLAKHLSTRLRKRPA